MSVTALLLALAAEPQTIGPPAPERAEQPLSQPIAIRFAPPIGETLRFRTWRSWQRDDNRHRVEFLNEYRFEAHGDGYRLETELITFETDPDDPRRAAIEATARPLVGLRYAMLLDEDGAVVGIESRAAVWREVIRGLEAVRDGLDAGIITAGPYRAVADQLLENFRRLDPAGQREQLAGSATELWALAGRSLAAGRAPHRAEIAAPWGGTLALDGTATTVRQPDGTATVQLRLSGQPASEDGLTPLRISEQAAYHIDPATGLVLRLTRERRSLAGGMPQIEHTRIERLFAPIPAASGTLEK